MNLLLDFVKLVEVYGYVGIIIDYLSELEEKFI